MKNLSILLCQLFFYLIIGLLKAEGGAYAEASQKVTVNHGELLPHMQNAYQSLIKVLIAMNRTEGLSPEAKFKETEKHLLVLKNEANRIFEKIKNEETGKAHLANELQKSTSQAYLRFKAGFPDQSKFFVSDIVSNCFSCHTSRSSKVDSQFAYAFSKDLDRAELDPFAKARFLSLSRQFEAAKDAYENILLGNDHTPVILPELN